MSESLGKVLENLLRDWGGVTYPPKTLSRRLNLLTKQEAKQVQQILLQVSNLAEKIDDILSKRAAKENDPWP